MRKNIFVLLIGMIAWIPAVSQSQKAAVKMFEDAMELIQTNSLKTNFGLVVKQQGSDELQVLKGSFMLQGSKFSMLTDEMQVYFDGKTQWAFMPDINEVSITNPDDRELAETNPLALLDAYKSKSTIRLLDKKEKEYNSLVLQPKDKSSDVKQIILRIKKGEKFPYIIQLLDKNGTISTVSLKNVQTGMDVNKNDFIFKPNLYEGIEINDLR